MKDRIVVNDQGIEIFYANGGGRAPWTLDVPWRDLLSVGIYAMELAPDRERWVAMDIDYTFGEYATVNHDAVGFMDAVVRIAQREGVEVPDLGSLQPGLIVEIWGVPA